MEWPKDKKVNKNPACLNETYHLNVSAIRWHEVLIEVGAFVTYATESRVHTAAIFHLFIKRLELRQKKKKKNNRGFRNQGGTKCIEEDKLK